MASQSSNMSIAESSRLRVLIASNGSRDIAQAQALVVRLSKHPKIETRAIVDEGAYSTHRLSQETLTLKNKAFGSYKEKDEAWRDIERSQVEWYKQQAYDLCKWADMLVLAPIDADTFAKMLHGIADCLLLDVLRGWDISKQILLIPGMTVSMWESPITAKQLSKVKRKWQWIRALEPILWHYESENTPTKYVVSWNAFNGVVDMIKNHAELLAIGHDAEPVASTTQTIAKAPVRPAVRLDMLLPPELWSSIFEYVGDWEIAIAFHVHTNLPTPPQWQQRSSAPKSRLDSYMHSLPWTFLTSPVSQIIQKLEAAPPGMKYLPTHCVRLILKFKLIEILTFLETHQDEIILNTIYPSFFPVTASAFYPNPQILEWWRMSPSFLPKSYTAQAIDGASASGFVNVLEWWRRSGLELKYTDEALSGASKNGQIAVLDWWKQAAKGDERCRPLQLRGVGSAISASERGQRPHVLRWWKTSGILIADSGAMLQQVELDDGVHVWNEA